MNDQGDVTANDEGLLFDARADEHSLGARLRHAREQRGWSQGDVASRLKLPTALIGRIENDDYAGLAHGVFLQGYLSSYARLVGVPLEQATSVAAAHTREAPLVATGTISRSRYLFDRYSGSATYLILTAIIVVPAVWLATHGGLEQNLARTTPLDPPAAATAPARETAADAIASDGSAEPARDVATGATSADPATVTSPAPPPIDSTPVIASMTPFPVTPAPAPAGTAEATAPAASGAHTLSMKLAQQSWVEVLGSDGRKLEYGILAAGSERSYHSDGPVSVRLGNVQGAELRSDGKLIDLTPFQRGNVAHVKLFGEAGVSRVDQ